MQNEQGKIGQQVGFFKNFIIVKSYIRVKNKVNTPNILQRYSRFSYVGWMENIGPQGGHLGFFSKFVRIFIAL